MTIEVRAFRGSRRSSVYRDHVLGVAAFGRIVAAARAAGLRVLGALDPAESRELDKQEARRLAEEASRLRATATLIELDDDLVAISAVAGWCGRATEQAWVRVQPL